MSIERSRHTATRAPGATPPAAQRLRQLVGRARSSSPYVSVAPASTHRHRRPARAAPAPRRARATLRSRGYAVAVAFHSTSDPLPLALASSGSAAIGRSGSATIPASSTWKCPAIRSIVSASNRSVLYSKRPLSPSRVSGHVAARDRTSRRRRLERRTCGSCEHRRGRPPSYLRVDRAEQLKRHLEQRSSAGDHGPAASSSTSSSNGRS